MRIEQRRPTNMATHIGQKARFEDLLSLKYLPNLEILQFCVCKNQWKQLEISVTLTLQGQQLRHSSL